MRTALALAVLCLMVWGIAALISWAWLGSLF